MRTALPDYIEAMLSPEAYPHPAGKVKLIQTHISYVFLAGDFVYKVKKPVDLGFLDFTTLEKRRHFCQQEVRLNRRLCHRMYLDVVPVSFVAGVVQVDAAGAVVDYAVKMRRLPDERMMPHLLRRDAVTGEMLASLAARIAEFHAAAEASDEIAAFGGLDTVLGNWRENFEQTEPYIGRTIARRQFEEIRAYVDDFSQREADLFAQRVGEGRVRDCHGDLRAEAICFEDDVCIFDCIEFNERFRYSDVAADLAFLAMDLDSRGRRDLADELVGLYLAQAADPTLPLVLNFYRCYRAYVRGKVDGFQLDEPEVPDRQKAAARRRARSFFRLAHAYATQSIPGALMITVGPSGTGKSYLANALAGRVGAALYSSDVSRKRLLGIEPTEPHEEPIDAGIYSPELTERTYRRMLEEAQPHLERGRPVLLDATYLRREQRAEAAQLAAQTGARFLALECRAGERLIRRRLARRLDEPKAVSDGRLEVYEAQKARYEPPTELPRAQRLIVDTKSPLPEQMERVVDKLSEG